MKKGAGRRGGGERDGGNEVPTPAQRPDGPAEAQPPEPQPSSLEPPHESLAAAAKTPVRQRAVRGAAGEARLDSLLLGAALQTPERQRGGTLAALLASPQTHSIFSSPDPPGLVPLFHESPRRSALGASPAGPSGVHSFGGLFQSPLRPGGAGGGAGGGEAGLRFETPSSRAPLDSLLASPRRSRRLASGGQGRKRAVSLEGVNWQLGGGGDGLGDAQPLLQPSEDDERDLVRDLLQSPGPKEVQQLEHLGDVRPYTRSRSTLAPADLVGCGRPELHFQAAAAAAEASKPPTHPRRRALDFSGAEAMQGDLQSMPVRRSLRHTPGDAALAGASGAHEGLPSGGMHAPQLPDLLPLDLSECERINSLHSPSARGPSCGLQGATPRRSSRTRAPLAGMDPFTSPRSALDAAAAVVAGGAMEAMLRGGGARLGGSLGLGSGPAAFADAPLRSLVRPAFDGLSRQPPGTAGGTGADGVSAMVPLGSGSQESRPFVASSSQQRLAGAAAEQQPQHSGGGSDAEPRRMREADQQERRRAGDGSASRAAAKKQAQEVELQRPSRSRRAAGSAPDGQPDDDQQAAGAQAAGGDGRGRQQRRRHSRGRHQLADSDTGSGAEQEQQGSEALEEEDAGEACDDADSDYGEHDSPRGAAAGRRGRSGRTSARRAAQRQHSRARGRSKGRHAGSDADGGPGAAAPHSLVGVSSLQRMHPGSGLQQLQLIQSSAPLAIGPTPDRQAARLAQGSLAAFLGPATPDDVRLAHVAHQLPPLRTCHCKKSQCLKLYCDCFANGTFCNGCACMDCRNTEGNVQEVVGRRKSIEARDPHAFANKLAQTADSLTNRKGCKCKKSHCLKKYCECFQLGVRCGETCKCSDCQNQDTDSVGLAASKQLLPRTLHRVPSGTRLQHPGQQQYWQLGQALPAGGGAATPSSSAAAAQAAAQTLVLRLPGGPGTPAGAQVLCLPLQSTPAAAVLGAVGAAAATPNPAKPLLPQFIQAAAAVAAASPTPSSGAPASTRRRTAVRAAEGAGGGSCLPADEQLPTPDQAVADGSHPHHLAMSSPTREASSDGEGASAGRHRTSRQLDLEPAAGGAGARSPAAASAQAAAASSSGGEGGDGDGGGGSETGRGRHRLAASSRGASSAKQQQQQQRRHGAGALAGPVPGSADGGQALAVQQHGVSTRRRLLQQQAKEGEDGSTCWALPPPGAPPPASGGAPAAPAPPPSAAAAEAAGGAEAQRGCIPVQAVKLGPDGPMVVLPQSALAPALCQAGAATSAAGLVADSAEEAAAAQEVGMLMAVTDEQGQHQYYFLPSAGYGGSQPGANAEAAAPAAGQQPAAAAAPAASAQAGPPQPHYQLRRRAAAAVPQAAGGGQDATAHPHGPEGQLEQQAPPQSPARGGRTLRSSASRTPVKRSTPVKRKAEAEEEQHQGDSGRAGRSPCRLQPSPAKVLHTSPAQAPSQQQQQQQQQAARQVVLSPVKLTKSGNLLVVPSQQQQQQLLQQPQEAQPQQQQQQQQAAPVQLFIASTADGQQFLLQAPAGATPALLLGSDGGLGAGCPTAPPPPPGGGAMLQPHPPCAADARRPPSVPQLQFQLGQQHTARGLASLVLPVAQQQGAGGMCSPPPSVRIAKDGGLLGGSPKLLLSPGDARSRDGAMYKFSPGCTTVFSPVKPAPGRGSPGSQ